MLSVCITSFTNYTTWKVDDANPMYWFYHGPLQPAGLSIVNINVAWHTCPSPHSLSPSQHGSTHSVFSRGSAEENKPGCAILHQVNISFSFSPNRKRNKLYAVYEKRFLRECSAPGRVSTHQELKHGLMKTFHVLLQKSIWCSFSKEHGSKSWWIFRKAQCKPTSLLHLQLDKTFLRSTPFRMWRFTAHKPGRRGANQRFSSTYWRIQSMCNELHCAWPRPCISCGKKRGIAMPYLRIFNCPVVPKTWTFLCGQVPAKPLSQYSDHDLAGSSLDLYQCKEC